VKKLVFAALAFALAAGSAEAQTIGSTPLRTISIQSIEPVPTGLAYHAPTNTLYVTGFSSRRIVRIPLPTALAAPTPALFATTASTDTPAGPVTWGGSRGLQSARISGSTLLVSGDQGTNGALLTYDVTAAAPAIPTARISGAERIGAIDQRISGSDFFGSNIVYTLTAVDQVALVNTALSAAVGTPLTGFPSNRRHVLAVGPTLYVSMSDAAAPENIAQVTGGTTTDLSGKTVAGTWFTEPLAVNSAVRYNLNSWNYTGPGGPRDYLIVSRSLSTAPDCAILLVDTASPATAPITLNNASHGIQENGGAIVVTVGSNSYLITTMNDIGGATTPANANGRVVIYPVNGSVLADPTGQTQVKSWPIYQ